MENIQYYFDVFFLLNQIILFIFILRLDKKQKILINLENKIPNQISSSKISKIINLPIHSSSPSCNSSSFTKEQILENEKKRKEEDLEYARRRRDLKQLQGNN